MSRAFTLLAIKETRLIAMYNVLCLHGNLCIISNLYSFNRHFLRPANKFDNRWLAIFNLLITGVVEYSLRSVHRSAFVCPSVAVRWSIS